MINAKHDRLFRRHLPFCKGNINILSTIMSKSSLLSLSAAELGLRFLGKVSSIHMRKETFQRHIAEKVVRIKHISGKGSNPRPPTWLWGMFFNPLLQPLPKPTKTWLNFLPQTATSFWATLKSLHSFPSSTAQMASVSSRALCGPRWVLSDLLRQQVLDK